jgi:hypothetical protein
VYQNVLQIGGYLIHGNPLSTIAEEDEAAARGSHSEQGPEGSFLKRF